MMHNCITCDTKITSKLNKTWISPSEIDFKVSYPQTSQFIILDTCVWGCKFVIIDTNVGQDIYLWMGGFWLNNEYVTWLRKS